MKPRLFLVAAVVMAFAILSVLPSVSVLVAQSSRLPEMQSGIVTVDFTKSSAQKAAHRVVAQAEFSSQGLSIAKGKRGAALESQAIAVPFGKAAPFLTLAIETLVQQGDGENVNVSIRTSNDGSTFGEWMSARADLHAEQGEQEGTHPQGRVMSKLLYLPKTTKAVQYRLELAPTPDSRSPRVGSCKLHFFSPGETPAEQLEQLQRGVVNDVVSPLTTPLTALTSPRKRADGKLQDLPRPSFVSRVGWGCPGGETTSGLSTTTVTHCIIHHSESPGNDVTDFPAAVRSIWNYHVNSNGWADIGYNWLIDKNGVIYKGRSWVGTNENSIGAHYCGKNSNTMGVCMIGAFGSITPTTAAQNSLVDIIAYRCSTAGIDPTVQAFHAGSSTTQYTVTGHRSINCTTCPGDALWALIPSLRPRIASALSGATPALSTSVSSLNVGSVTAGQTQTATYTVSFSNLTAPVSLSVSGTDAALFSISTDGTTFGSTASIAANATSPATITVRYAPSAAGSHSASIAHASGSLTASVTLSGSATAPPQPPSISTSVSSLALGSVETGQTQTATYTVTYANVNSTVNFSISGANASQFALSTNGTTFGASATLTANRINLATSSWYVAGTQGLFIGTALPGAVISASVDGFAIANNVTAGADGRYSFNYTFGSTGAARQLVVTATSNGAAASVARSIEVRASGSAAAADPSTYPAAIVPVTVTVRYAPTAAGSHVATITQSGGTASATVDVSGTATTPAPTGSITTSVSSLALGSVQTGQTQTATYTVTYSGLTAPVSFALSGANASQFALSTNGTAFGASGSLALNRVNVATSAWYVVGTQGKFIGTALPGAVIGAAVDGFAIASNVTAGADGRFSFNYTFGGAGAARALVITATSGGSTASTSRSIEVRASGSAAAADPGTYPASINPATITVRYAPTAAGSHAASITQSSGGVSATVSLSGTGTVTFPAAPTASGPKRELRAVWIATVSNIDWPLSQSDTPAKQQQDLINILDNHKANGINSVMLQVRPAADALYAKGRREPWSAVLTGTQGQNPGWDPLQFAIDEAHKRGMELHAWINPFRSVPSSSTVVSSSHISQTQPSWHLTFTNPYKLLNPGLAVVRQYVASVVMDVVRNYEIDGIHFDDYFYPYSGTTTQDQATFSANSRGFTDIAAWRRDNVNLFVKMVRDSINALKPFVKFGISPFGIWKSGVPAGISGLSAYDDIYCDATAWLQAGNVDYVAPQLYWKFGGAQDYAALLNWWVTQANGRHIYSGNGAYRLSETAWSANDITSQLRFNRTNGITGAPGAVLFSSKDITGNTKSIRDSLRNNLYRTIALPPTMSWKDATPPNAPTGLVFTASATAITVSWQAGAAASDGDVAQNYLVYRFMSGRDEVNTNSHQFIVGKTSSTSFVDNTAQSGFAYTYVVTALDKLQNESNPNPQLDNVSLGGGTLLAAVRPKQIFPSLADDAFIASAATLAADSLRVKNAAVPYLGLDVAVSDDADAHALNALKSTLTSDASITVYPNPTQESLTVQAFYDAPTEVQVIVRTLLGQELLMKRERISGILQTRINVESLPAGAYIVELRNGTRIHAAQFLKR
jgi:uncharacterized lipoprotein YddW (UPF0748 family)